jgi:hypothetical protein
MLLRRDWVLREQGKQASEASVFELVTWLVIGQIRDRLGMENAL